MLLCSRMTATGKTVTQCRSLPWVWGMVPSSEAVWIILTVRQMLIGVMNSWLAAIPVVPVPSEVLVEGPAVVAVAPVLAALVAVPRLQLRERMPMIRMLAERLP